MLDGSRELAEKVKENKLMIDGVEYLLDSLSENGKANLESIKFVDQQLLQLNNELAVADTARIGYSNALQLEVEKSKSDTP